MMPFDFGNLGWSLFTVGVGVGVLLGAAAFGVLAWLAQ